MAPAYVYGVARRCIHEGTHPQAATDGLYMRVQGVSRVYICVHVWCTYVGRIAGYMRHTSDSMRGEYRCSACVMKFQVSRVLRCEMVAKRVEGVCIGGFGINIC